MGKLTQLKALADDWAVEAKHAANEAALNAHFDSCSAHQLIEMWETGKNPKGKPLSQWEGQALVEAWCRVFGELPPTDDDEYAPEPSAPQPDLPADDTMLRAKDVVRLTGLSLSTLKRMVLDGRFVKPVRLSPRRIGWPARDVKAWLDAAEDARTKGRY